LPGSLADATAAGERLGHLGQHLFPGDVKPSYEQQSVLVAAGGAAKPVLQVFPCKTFCLSSAPHSWDDYMQFLSMLLQSLELHNILSDHISLIRHSKLQARFIPCANSPQPH